VNVNPNPSTEPGQLQTIDGPAIAVVMASGFAAMLSDDRTSSAATQLPMRVSDDRAAPTTPHAAAAPSSHGFGLPLDDEPDRKQR
jgi:hypothetical protein